MPVETEADRLVFLGDFNPDCTYTPQGQSARVIKVNFDNEALSVDPLSGQSVSTVNPHLICRSSDLVGDCNKNDRFVIAGVTYAPRDFRPDGTGMTTVELKKA